MRPAARRQLRLGVLRALLLMTAAFTLAACSSDNLGDLRAYVQKIKARKSGHVEPIPEIRPFETYTYHASGRRSPFEPWKTVTPAAEAGKGKGPHPNLHRRKEPLEAFPLENLRMVGTLEQKGRLWALVKAPDGIIYRVTKGNYLGQNHGRINRISEEKIELVELVPDGLGGWRERSAKLELAE